MKNLQGKVALITGASRGIGRALALQLTAAGVDVFGCARDQAALQAVRAQCQGPGVFAPMPADVTDPEAIDALASRISAHAGRLDILVNNAAILGPRKPLEDVSLDAWRQTQAINVDGVFIVSTRCVPLLRAADSAIVINVSSSVGRVGRAGWGPYGVSKHAVEGITETLAEELAADGVCVVSINPGGTATDMRQEAYPDEDPATLPSAEDIASTFRLLVATLDVGQTGRKYDARALLPFANRTDLAGDALPFLR